MTSFSRDAFYDDILELLRRLQSVGFCTDLDTSADGNAGRGEENLRQMFEGILSVFVKDISQAENYLPFPVMLGQEGAVDVCKLYCDVSKKGGYNSVTTYNIWPSVAQKVGHGSTGGRAIKLVYVKYLNGLDQWFEKVLGRKVGDKSEMKDDTILDQPVRGRKYYSSSMKKRKSMDRNLEILSWVKRVAKKAGDRIIGYLLLEKEFNQALLVRQAIFKPPDGALLQKKQMMHPSLYEDCVGVETRKRSTLYARRKKKVPLGPLFQAIVPDWTGVRAFYGVFDDLTWYKRIWPPERNENKLLIERVPVGKGRHSCGCERRGSVECVRFHVSQKRLRLMTELGPVFHVWKFDRMGEEVALSWKEEEEWKFKAIVCQNPPSLNRSFWKHLYLNFSSVKRSDLVSYYYNVFLLRRRSYQNRVTLDAINSDDEESEFCFSRQTVDDDTVTLINEQFMNLE